MTNVVFEKVSAGDYTFNNFSKSSYTYVPDTASCATDCYRNKQCVAGRFDADSGQCDLFSNYRNETSNNAVTGSIYFIMIGKYFTMESKYFTMISRLLHGHHDKYM